MKGVMKRKFCENQISSFHSILSSLPVQESHHYILIVKLRTTSDASKATKVFKSSGKSGKGEAAGSSDMSVSSKPEKSEGSSEA